MPWRRDLGGPRVQIELAEELRAKGHSVEKFSLEDALRESKPPKFLLESLPWFAARAHHHILHGPDYDVIDAHQGTITRSKKSLGFDGHLVVRSGGLYYFYSRYQRYTDPHRAAGIRHRIGRLRERLASEASQWAVGRSFDLADQILVHNEAEYDFLQLNPRWGRKAHVTPAAITRAFLLALQSGSHQGIHPHPPSVAFVGCWHPRKGSRDWPRLAHILLSRIPELRFHFLGTGVERTPPGLPPDAVWVPHYKPEELPALLTEVDVGVFPSYLEGFGIAVVEQLAAGIPVVAYDVPGPRDILRPVDPSLLIRPGDVGSLAERVIALFFLSSGHFAELRSRSITRAKELTWDEWVGPMIDYYCRTHDDPC